MSRRKQIDRICQNCKLFDPASSRCSVVVLYEGERHRLPVHPKDPCFFENAYFDPVANRFDDFADEIKEVKFWVEDENGQKTDKHGTVKIEYPEGFVGNEDVFALPDIGEELEDLQKKKFKSRGSPS